MDEKLLSIQNLSVSFNIDDTVVKAIENISFDVAKGETVVIVGESGSGKSVTALSVLKLLPPPPLTSITGKILFHYNEGTIDLLRCPQSEIRALRGNAISMIFQEPMTSLNPVKKVGKQVEEMLVTHFNLSAEAAKTRVIEMFEEVNLPEPERMFHKYPHQISGGQKQRIMIAMAMICKPQLLICDEPTTALDVTVQKNILELLKQLQRQYGMSVIFITHDLGVVSEIADRIVVMYKGKIMEEGSMQRVLFHPTSSYTEALLQCRPALFKKGQRLPVVGDKPGHRNKSDFEKTIAVVHSPAKHQPLISVENAHVWFPSRYSFSGKAVDFNKAVNGVSFTIFQGETLGLVGESGCGKTTLGRAILGLIPLSSGKVVFRERDIADFSGSQMKQLRKQMQIVFQDPYSSLDPIQTVGEAIMEPLIVHNIGSSTKERKKIVMDLMEKVGLKSDFFYRHPHEFSGGQRQRIVIARALVLNPSFVVCDESVSALDVSVQAQVLNLLNDLKEEFRFTALFISHDLSVIKYVSDRIVVMNKGKIEESGMADEVYLHPQTSYTKKLIDSIPGKILNAGETDQN